MTSADELERLWRELRRLDQRIDECAGRGDVHNLARSIVRLEDSVLSAIEYQRDSVVQPLPSLSPSRKIRLKLWEWVALAAAAAIVGAAGTVVTVLAQSCGGG